MPRHFSISFSDLSFEKQEDLVADIKQNLLEQYEQEIKESPKKEWHVEPKTWQETYCRTYNVNWSSWNDLDETSEDFKAIDWKWYLEEYAEEEARKKLAKGFKYLELEVEL